MNARLQLTDMERAQCRKSVFMDKRSDYRFVLEALGESGFWHKAYLIGDAVDFSREVDKVVLNYCEALDLFAEAERDFLASIERDGGRRLA